MSKPGRKPLPTAAKKLAGNPGHRPLPKNEPRYDQADTGVPRGMLDDAGRKLWRELAPALAAAGVMTQADRPALMLMCMHYSLALQAHKRLQDDGLITEDERGLMRKHPAAQLWRDNSTAWLRYAAQFGITPSARTNVQTVQPQQLTLADQLFAIIGGDA